jgi:hypothetical protein
MDIILETRQMIAEAQSESNDGYLKRFYMNRLIMLKEILDLCISQEEIERFKLEVKD